MSESNDLKPCPFCDDQPVVRRMVEEYPADGTYPAGEFDARFYVQCDTCAISIEDEYRSNAIEAWNRRAGEAEHIPAKLA